jgi:hypothetical protein
MDTRTPPLAAKLKEERNKFKEVGKRMTLKEFSSRKKVKLPCLLKVCSGYTSLCERYSFGIDQLFVVIEIKTIDVVKMSEARSKENTGVHEIPLQTDRFTVVPTLDSEWKNDLLRGGRIEVHQLLECISLPKIVQVVFDFVTKEQRTYVRAGSFLFPQEVKKKTEELEKRILVAKLEDGSSVNVTADCTAKFDIGHTASFRLSLSQAIKLISLPFQCTLQSHEDDIYFTRTVVQHVDKGIFLFGVTKAKQGSIQDEIDSFKELSEIPANLGISVVPMAPKHEEILEDIYESAQSYYNIRNSHPSNVIQKQRVPGGIDSPGGSPIMDPMSPAYVTLMNSNPNSFPANSDHTGTSPPPKIDYYTAGSVSGKLSPANRRKMLQGRTLPDLPQSAVDRQAASSPVSELPSSVSNPQQTYADVCYSTANTPQRSTPPPQGGLIRGSPSLQKRHEIQKRPLPDVPLNAENSSPTTHTDISDMYNSADDTIVKNPDTKAPQSPRTDVVSSVSLACEPNTPNSPQQQHPHDAGHTEAMSHNESESAANIKILRSLDEVKTLELLDAMNLGVYKDAFTKEYITGEILSEIDEEMLHELGVQSSLHKMRLMRIVRGRENVNSILRRKSASFE